MATTELLYSAALAQFVAESYLDSIPPEETLSRMGALALRLQNGNNHFLHRPEQGQGGTRLTLAQQEETLGVSIDRSSGAVLGVVGDKGYDIIDHLPNQASGFSATLLKSKVTGEYTLAFRSTEYRDIESGGDAERDSIRGAAGDIAFNGMAFAQVSSMQKYWQSLVDGTRAFGATPDNPVARDTRFVRSADLAAFTAAVTDGARINVSGYSLGGHLATTFGTLHGEKVSSLYLFNSSGVGRIRDGFPLTAYRDALAAYDFYMRPENLDAAILRVLDWASRAGVSGELGLGARIRTGASLKYLLPPFISTERPFIPKDFQSFVGLPVLPMTDVIAGLVSLAREQALHGVPKGADGLPLIASSAVHFLVSLFASEALQGTYGQTLGRAGGAGFASLQESGLIPADVRIHQVSGLAAAGAPSVATLGDMLRASDWNIVADSGIRAAPDTQLLSVYIEDQPIAAGLPFSDRGWGDFGNTHSITLIVDSLAVTRMLQKAQPELAQETAEQILRAASNLRKERYSALPRAALTEHDTLERVVDAFGRVLFARSTTGEIDWARDLASADGVASFGLLEYRDPLHARIRSIEEALAARGLSGKIQIVSLSGWSAADIAAAAGEATERGEAVRYALKELNAFYVLGAGLYDSFGRDTTLALRDPATASGSITNEWIEDRADFLALKLRLGTADHAYELGSELIGYSVAGGAVALSIAAADASSLLAPDSPMSKRTRSGLVTVVENAASSARARKVVFGTDGDPAANPATTQGGADTLRGKAGADRIYGEGGNDKLFGGAGSDYLEGGAGDDDLSGDTGNDVLAGGLGYDSYFWQLGDGFDRVTDTREASGEMRGRIVLRVDTALHVPRLFKRDTAAPGETWRSPDRSLLLTHGANWVLSFPDGEIDLGPDLRDGDFGFHLEGIPTPPPPTVIGGIVADSVVVGPNRTGAFLVGEYGHDRLYAEAPIALEAVLLVANAAPLPGWGLWFSAGPGDDLAIATAAADILYGGGGADTLVGGPGNDLLDGDADWVPALSASDIHLRWEHGPDPFDSYFTDFHTPGLELFGTSILPELYRDQIADGDDIVYGGGGDDRIHGGGGDDLLYGDPGDDLLVGGAGDDVLIGGDGDDRITGELHGYAPIASEIVGGRIITYLHHVPAYGDDIIDGGDGADELIGEGGADVIFGGEGADTIQGDIAGLPAALHGNDIMDGGGGDDLIEGQGGDDLLLGGDGDDRLIGDSEVDPAFHGADRLRGDDGNDVLIGAGGSDELLGGRGDDTLVGDAFDVPSAFHADDILDGGEGDDVLYGLGGADELFGDEGADRLYGDDPESPFIGQADFLDGGDGDDRLQGHAGDDRLQGGSGDDRLFGDGGNDTLAGGPGSDVLDGGSGDNVYEFAAGDGVDRLIAGSGLVTVAFLDGIDVTALRASRILGGTAGTAPLQIQYSAIDSITIEALADVNRLRIRIGDDELLGGAELMRLTESMATAVPGSTASEVLASDGVHTDVFGFDGDDLLLGSSAFDRLDGGSGDDQLYGMSGNDSLVGGEGADRLFGGLDDDRLEGGPGDDRYHFAPAEGIDTVLEVAGDGYDVIALTQGLPLDSVRLRRAGNDLVIAERDGSGRLFAGDWYAPFAAADRGIDAIVHDAGILDIAAMLSREIADRTVAGTADADTLTGDEFGDIVIGGAGDDLLAGLAGDDRYVYARGDGSDRIVDSGGFDIVEFGAGIAPGEIELVGTPDGSGGISIKLQIAGESVLLFGAARDERVDAFQFASGEIYDYSEMLRRSGGLRIEGGDGDDLVAGTFFPDALYGFAGDDRLSGDGGEDTLVGAEGDDVLAGGANDDTYVFNLGDGRDSILEYSGSDEYLLFRGYFLPSGQRAFELDGTIFATHEPLPGAFGETFNITLGSVAGGNDTIRFGEGIVPEGIRFGLDLGKALLPYPWLVPAASGGFTVGTVQAEQVAYVLEIGTGGDAIELLWPHVELEEHAGASLLESAPVERLVFGEAEAVTLADVFALAGGLTYVIGTSRDDVLSVERVLPGGWLAGGAGNDRYIRPEQGALGILETGDGGSDTIVFGEAVTSDSVRLRLEHDRVFLDTSAGRVELRGFSASEADRALVENFEFSDGTTLDYGALLLRGIEVAGTPFTDHLTGTSAYDFVVAGAGDDRIDSGGGDDIVDAAAGDDWIAAGAGDDWMAAGRGNDLMRGGPGRDRYLFLRGDGDDLIEEAGHAGEEDTLLFGGDIEPAEVGARRAGADLVLELAGAGGRMTMREWFVADAMRVERVAFNDGTHWDVAALAGLAGEPVPAPAPADPPIDPPGEPPVIAEPPVDPPAEPPLSAEPPVDPIPGEPPGVPVVPPESTEVLEPTVPPAASEPPSAPATPPPSSDPVVETAASTASSFATASGPAFESTSPIASARTATSASGAAPVAASPSPSVGEGVSAAVSASTASTLEVLAAGGFVSPGRPAARSADEASEETVEPDGASTEELPAETPPETEPSGSVARYWRWMHARLDAHLEHTEAEDLGAPAMHEYRPLALSTGDALEALAPSRSVGIRDRAVFDARAFDGLRDGFARLG